MSYLIIYPNIIFTLLETLTLNIMISQSIGLYSWSNGVVMIAIFAVVCITLVGILINFLMGGKPKEESDNIDASSSFEDKQDSTESAN